METNTTLQTGQQSAKAFWMGKIFSLFGLVPLGIYVVFHLYSKLSSLSGPEVFDLQLRESRAWPMIVPITILVIWIPIVFHGLYGLFGIRKAKVNVGRLPFFGNAKYVLQRLSGIGLLLFIPAHVYKTRIEPGLFGSTLDFHHMAEGLHEPLTLGIYILGVLGVAFHLANGLWQFSIGWGLTRTQRGMLRMERFSYAFFVVLLAMGYASIWGFWL